MLQNSHKWRLVIPSRIYSQRVTQIYTDRNAANFFFRTPLELQDVPYLYSLFMAAPYAASGALTFL